MRASSPGSDGVWNFDSILAYRAEHFPPEAPAEAEKPAEAEESEPGQALLPFSPALIYMPIELLTQNVGIKNLRLDLIKQEKGRIAQIVMTNGLTFDMGAVTCVSTISQVACFNDQGHGFSMSGARTSTY